MASSLRVMAAVLVLASFSAAAGDGETPAAAPLHSIVFVTKRPGGYDVLLEALARQTVRNYELICVDELADHRAHSVRQMAAHLQVNLAAITRSKPKTHHETRFGIANAINTGLCFARCAARDGRIVATPSCRAATCSTKSVAGGRARRASRRCRARSSVLSRWILTASFLSRAVLQASFWPRGTS